MGNILEIRKSLRYKYNLVNLNGDVLLIIIMYVFKYLIIEFLLLKRKGKRIN
ncbi:hypothetical protein IC006_0174 [Sulfuracidifex tepidarius]|uniref:Uncharacterized protein n=1 Tax=Sulfuracidifex tepidarius TaxID=1294262 RepID=A0A510DZH4_9CREN|nr:hypothetical protein IC006_0174 [Sulfuracidifex tepidarius]BBG25651.1 hypothetical protein IC007_0156 [Sulfuracidifex tepidarius]